ncbi:unnamed protein product [Amoebophrya sp. A120]|nr:unnamed protein product [Amoebophrya sp. A120]|eukprot:GSA120T00009029001.1
MLTRMRSTPNLPTVQLLNSSSSLSQIFSGASSSSPRFVLENRNSMTSSASATTSEQLKRYFLFTVTTDGCVRVWDFEQLLSSNFSKLNGNRKQLRHYVLNDINANAKDSAVYAKLAFGSNGGFETSRNYEQLPAKREQGAEHKASTAAQAKVLSNTSSVKPDEGRAPTAPQDPVVPPARSPVILGDASFLSPRGFSQNFAGFANGFLSPRVIAQPGNNYLQAPQEDVDHAPQNIEKTAGPVVDAALSSPRKTNLTGVLNHQSTPAMLFYDEADREHPEQVVKRVRENLNTNLKLSTTPKTTGKSNKEALVASPMLPKQAKATTMKAATASTPPQSTTAAAASKAKSVRQEAEKTRTVNSKALRANVPKPQSDGKLSDYVDGTVITPRSAAAAAVKRAMGGGNIKSSPLSGLKKKIGGLTPGAGGSARKKKAGGGAGVVDPPTLPDSRSSRVTTQDETAAAASEEILPDDEAVFYRPTSFLVDQKGPLVGPGSAQASSREGTGTSARSGIVAGVANPIAAGTPLLNTGRSSLLLTPHSSARNPQQPVTLPQSQEQQPQFQVTRQQSAILLNTSGAQPLTPSGPRAAPLLLSGNNKPTLMTLTPGRRTGLSNQSSARLLTGQSPNPVGPGALPQSSTLVPAGQQQQQQQLQQLGEQAATPGPTFLSSRSSMQVQVLPPQPKQPLSPRDMKEMKKGSTLDTNGMKKDNNINTTASKPELLLNSTESQHFGMMAMTAPHPHLHADFHDHIGLNVSKGLTEKHEDFAHLHWIEPKPGHLHPPAGIPGFTSPQIVHRQFTSPAAVGTGGASATSQLKTTPSGGFLNNLGFGNTTLDPAEIASLGPLPPPAALDLLEIVNKRPATVEEVRKRSPSPPPVRNSPLAVWRETGKPRPIPFLASTREQQAVLAAGGDPRTSSPQHSPTTMTRLNKFQILDPVAQVFEQNVANLLSKTNQELELGMNTWRGGLDRPKNILKPHFASPRFPPRRGGTAAGGQQQQETAQEQIHPSSYNRTMEEEERPRQQLPMPASSTSAAASPERNLKALGLGDDGRAATSSQSPTTQIRPSALLEQQYLHLENMSNRTQNLAAELLNRRRSREEDLVQKRQSLRMVAQLKMKASQAVRRVSANSTTSVQEGGISKTASSKSKSPPPGSAARRHEFDKMHKKRTSRPEIAETRMTVNNGATDPSKQDDLPLFVDQVDKLPGGRESSSSSSVSSGSLYNSGTSTPRSAVVRTAANINIISPEGGIVRGTSPAAAGAAGDPLSAVASTTTQQESSSSPKRGTVFDSANNLLTAVDQHFSKTLLQVSSDRRIAPRVQEQVSGGTSGRNTPRTEAGPGVAGVHHQQENKEPIVVFASSLLRRASERGEHEIDNLVLPPAMSRASSFNSERGAGVEQASSKKSINEALANKIKIAEELQQKLGKETKSKERLLQGLDAVRDILIESVKDHMEDIKRSGSPRTETQEQQRAEFLLAAEKLSNGTKMNNNKSNRMFATPPTFIHPPKDASKQGTILPTGSHDQKKQHVFQLLKTLHKQEGGNKETVNSLRQELNEFLAALDEEEVFS